MKTLMSIFALLMCSLCTVDAKPSVKPQKKWPKIIPIIVPATPRCEPTLLRKPLPCRCHATIAVRGGGADLWSCPCGQRYTTTQLKPYDQTLPTEGAAKKP